MTTALTCSSANIIAQWDFNSLLPDDNPSTGTVLPSIGGGAAFVIGGTTAVFAPGSGNDTAGTDNSAWNTSAYAAQGTNNKTAGVQFAVSTVGYSNIAITWEHKVSSSASKYCRLQYSRDGRNFCDHAERVASMSVASSASVFESLSRNLESVPGIADNPSFAFRIVTEFESTATEAGTEGYVTTFSTNSYSRSGTIRFDLVTVTGTPIAGANTAPFASCIPEATAFEGKPIPPLPVKIRDGESRAEDLSLSAFSSNPVLVPNTPANIWFGGNGSNRTLNLIPVPRQCGVAPITVTVSDGTNRASSVFPLIVLPSASVMFYDPFCYSNGALLSNSAYLWGHRAGAYGQCEITNGELQITSTQTEDVLAPLLAGPCGPGSNLVLYARFKTRFLSLPKSTPGYFAHFANGNILRARIFASAANSLPGCFKLLISNGSDSSTLLPWNLHTNTSYTLITRYNIDSSAATLWVNPTAESDSGITATDVRNPVSITSYGFRQDAQLASTILIDDLSVGLSFAAVAFAPPVQPDPLAIQASRGAVILRWPSSGSQLQSAAAPTGPFADVVGANSPYTLTVSAPCAFFRLKP